MAKTSKSVWYCTSCGNESPKWMGRCPGCGEWNTMVEAPVATSSRSGRSGGSGGSVRAQSDRVKTPSLQRLSEIDTSDDARISLGIGELDRLLGGGVVPGSLILVGGEPGIGKSTLSLQIPLQCSGLKTLYVSGEESERQVKMRAGRLGGSDADCYILCETLIERVLDEARAMLPDLMIVDSVQTMYTETLDSVAASVSQVKEVAALLLRFAKDTGIPIILIGHITKDGYIAGPKILEHIVDVVLQFEGDNRGAYRLMRGIKNRFGSTSELAVFEMTGSGLREVVNPSEMLIPFHKENLSGTAVAAMLDGNRSFLFEVQALVSSAAYGTAQRSTTGFDIRRLNMLLAVLEKRAGFKLGAKDVFLNMAGGIRVNDPACDLAVVAAVLSSNFDLPLSSEFCFAAEVGLSGEIRPVSQTDKRISEASRLGFKRIYVSSYSKIEGSDPKITPPVATHAIEVVQLPDIPALVRALFK